MTTILSCLQRCPHCRSEGGHVAWTGVSGFRVVPCRWCSGWGWLILESSDDEAVVSHGE